MLLIVQPSLKKILRKWTNILGESGYSTVILFSRSDKGLRALRDLYAPLQAH